MFPGSDIPLWPSKPTRLIQQLVLASLSTHANVLLIMTPIVSTLQSGAESGSWPSTRNALTSVLLHCPKLAATSMPR